MLILWDLFSIDFGVHLQYKDNVTCKRSYSFGLLKFLEFFGTISFRLLLQDCNFTFDEILVLIHLTENHSILCIPY